MPSSSSWYDSGSEAPECVARAGDVATRIGALPESELIARKLSPNAASPARAVLPGAPRHATDPTDLRDHACMAYSFTGDGADWRFDAPTASIYRPRCAPSSIFWKRRWPPDYMPKQRRSW
jgi:hypothetical protein